MNNELSSIIANLDFEREMDRVNLIIKEYQPFILNTISNLKNEYIQVENDEEFSIGLIAFTEAMQRYDKDRGSFLHYAKLVIESRVKSFWHNKKRQEHSSLEDIDNTLSSNDNNENELKEEIRFFEEELNKFGMDFEDLIESSPRHIDTRERAVDIAVKTSDEDDLVKHLYSKRRLPITKMSKRFTISVKVIKRSKKFITATVIVIVNKYTGIFSWIRNIKKAPNNN